MADTPATLYSDIMAKLQGNQAGGLEALPDVTLMEAKVRQQVSSIVLAAQASASVFWVGRVPLGAAIKSIEVITDTSLATAQISFGDAHNANPAIYGAAAVLTAVNTLTRFGPPTALAGVEITQGYDYLGTNTNRGMPQTPSPAGGAGFEDIIMVTSVAALPGAGNLRVIITYTVD